MVARDQNRGRGQPVDELREDPVQQIHRVRGRDRSVIDVPGYHHGVGLLFPDHGDDLLQHVPLVFNQVHRVEQLAQVPVAGVQDLHGFASWRAAFTAATVRSHALSANSVSLRSLSHAMRVFV